MEIACVDPKEARKYYKTLEYQPFYVLDQLCTTIFVVNDLYLFFEGRCLQTEISPITQPVASPQRA